MNTGTGTNDKAIAEAADDVTQDISMEDVFGPVRPRTLKNRIIYALSQVYWRARRSLYRFVEPKTLFRGVKRNLSDFCWSTKLGYEGFTRDEIERADALAAPFNKMFATGDENEMSMYAVCMDEDGFIFRINDDLTDSCIDTVHEKQLESFLTRVKKDGYSNVEART